MDSIRLRLLVAKLLIVLRNANIESSPEGWLPDLRLALEKEADSLQVKHRFDSFSEAQEWYFSEVLRVLMMWARG